jgi:hypothetical protein
MYLSQSDILKFAFRLYQYSILSTDGRLMLFSLSLTKEKRTHTRVHNFVDHFKAVCIMATGVPLAARHI